MWFDDDLERVIVGMIFVKARSMQFVECRAKARDTEGDVGFENLHRGGRTPERFGYANNMQFLAVGQLEPRTRKWELGPRHFRQSQEATVESSRLFNVAHRYLHVVKRRFGHIR